jgi:N utilization substance protein B
MGRKQARESAMQLLFQIDSNSEYSESVIAEFLENFELDGSEADFIREAVSGVMVKKIEIDEFIARQLEGWSIGRLALVDLATLRLAVYEILFREDIPVEVSINEAIEISKKYSTEDSYKYVNGVLGGFVRALEKNE